MGKKGDSLHFLWAFLRQAPICPRLSPPQPTTIWLRQTEPRLHNAFMYGICVYIKKVAIHMLEVDMM